MTQILFEQLMKKNSKLCFIRKLVKKSFLQMIVYRVIIQVCVIKINYYLTH